VKPKRARVTRNLEKIAKFLKKVAKTVAKQKKAKIFTFKLNLNVQNIYVNPLFKPSNTYYRPSFEPANLGANVKFDSAKRVAQMLPFLWATSSFQKSTKTFQK